MFCRYFAYVAGADIYFARKTVFFDIFRGKGGYFFLNLKCAYFTELSARGGKQGNDSAARAELCGECSRLFFMYAESRYASVPKASEPSFW